MIAEFVKLYPQYLAPNNSMEFISDDGGEKYNGCHCGCFRPVVAFTGRRHLIDWSNMEIADMEFWRGEAYTAYVDYLESTGGFFYEVSLGSDRHPNTFSPVPLSLLTEMG